MVPTMGKGLRIGEFLVSKKILTPNQVELILEYSHERGLRFGEAGMELGFLSRESFVRLFSPSPDVDLFQLYPQYFPKETKNLLNIDSILRYGVLPLGSRIRGSWFGSRKIINLGFLSPRKPQIVQEVKNLILAQPSDIEKIDFRIFVILADQFLNVLESVYQINENQILTIAKDPTKHTEIDSTLRLFLEIEDAQDELTTTV